MFGWSKREPRKFGFGEGTRRNRYAIGRREWIESLVMIDDKRARCVPLKANQSQRNMEAQILRQSRAGKPVRIVCCKVRQNGWSTYELAVFLEGFLRNTNVKARLITDREELCETLLARVKRMFQRLHKTDGTPWNIPTQRSNRDMLVLGEPFNSSIHVVSAATPNPGFGETNLMVAMEETSKWLDAADKGKGVELALPEVPGSLAFDVSQPKGNTGYFADKFKRAWYRGMGLADPSGNDDVTAGVGWVAMFIPWFLHQEYRWTRIGSNPPQLPTRVHDAIAKSLTPDEEILLKQRYLIRGRGWMQVDYDQLAWRRYYVTEKCNGNLQTFHEQCPAFPEEAFLASGRPAFNVEHVQRAITAHKREPIFKGRILQGGEQSADPRGELWIFDQPVKGRQYAIGVDTAAGSSQGDLDSAGLAKTGSKDPSTIVVTDLETEAPVAEWYGWMPPHEFAREVVKLSDLYEATVAIETHPSQHGLAVYQAAEDAGCRRLFVQQRWDDREGKFVQRKGWAMSTQAKAILLSRITEALAHDAPIPSARILQELLDAQLDDKEKIDRVCRNDLMIAYGLSLKLGDAAKQHAFKQPEPERLPPTGSDEAFWRDRRLRQGHFSGKIRYDAMNGEGI